MSHNKLLVLGLLLIIGASSAKADQLENLAFAGTAACFQGTLCTIGSSGPVTGTYTLDVTTQMIVGSWSFSTPFGVISSGDSGASTSVTTILGDIQATFQESTPSFFEFIGPRFPGTDPQEIGALATDLRSIGCVNTPGTNGCEPDYKITGATSLVPEPSSVILLGTGVAGLVLRRKRNA
jgi:hypothetical protein